MSESWKTRYIGAEIKALGNLIKRQIDDMPTLSEPNQPTGMQGMIVGYLCNHLETDVFQRDIEAEFDIRRSTATGILKIMERKGLLTREPVDFDERLKKLVLTPSAVAIHKKVIVHLTGIETQLAKGLTKDEIDDFFRIIDIMKKNMA